MKQAQVSAPIELLIGVIMLTMVLIIAFYTYEQMKASHHEQKIKASIAMFANKLEEVYGGSPGTKKVISFDLLPPEGGTTVEFIRFAQGTPNYCSKFAGPDSCYVLITVINVVIENRLSKEITFAQALKIPTDVTIEHKKLGLNMECFSTNSDDFRDMMPVYGFQECFTWKPQIYTLAIEKVDKDTLRITD